MPELLRDVEAQEVEPAFSDPSQDIRRPPGHVVVLRVAERHPSEQITLEKVSDRLRDQLVGERARALAEEARAAAQTKLEAGEPVAEVALASGANWQRFEAVARGAQEIPREVKDVGFRLDRPTEGGKSVGSPELAGGGTAVGTDTRVQDGNLESMSETEVQSLPQLVADRTARLDLGGSYESMQRDADISRVD